RRQVDLNVSSDVVVDHSGAGHFTRPPISTLRREAPAQGGRPCHIGPDVCLGSCSMNQLRPAIPQLATERKPSVFSRLPPKISPFRDSDPANNKLANPVKCKSRYFSTFVATRVAGNCLTKSHPAPHNNLHTTIGRPVVLAGGVPSPSGQFGMTRKIAGPTLL